MHDPAHLALAAAIAAHSSHPFSRALAAADGANHHMPPFETLREHPGCGIESEAGDMRYRLGRPAWALGERSAQAQEQGSSSVLSCNGKPLAILHFVDPLRPVAGEALAALKEEGIDAEILSGDNASAVGALARTLGIAAFKAGVLP